MPCGSSLVRSVDTQPSQYLPSQSWMIHWWFGNHEIPASIVFCPTIDLAYSFPPAPRRIPLYCDWFLSFSPSGVGNDPNRKNRSESGDVWLYWMYWKSIKVDWHLNGRSWALFNFDLSGVRKSVKRTDANQCVPILLRLSFLRGVVEAQAGRLLCVLFLRRR